jgi:hypothetical protein
MRGEFVKLLKELNEVPPVPPVAPEAPEQVTEPVEPKRTMVKASGKETDNASEAVKIIVDLKKQQASQATKFAQQLEQIVLERKKLESLEKDIKEEAREMISAQFKAGDEVMTRVVRTASYLLTISKETTRTTETFDKEKLYKAFEGLVPELALQMKAIADTCVVIKKSIVASSVTIKANEGVGEAVKAVSKKIAEYAKTVLDAAKKLSKETIDAVGVSLDKVDKQLEQIDKLVGNTESTEA